MVAGDDNKLRTLIVEDEEIIRTPLCLMLSMMGHAVESAATLAEAYAKLKWRPQFVVLDLGLPDGNGVDLLRHIRNQKLPICVAVTTAAHGAIAAEAIRADPDVFLEKPIDLGLLERWLKGEGGRRRRVCMSPLVSGAEI